MRRRIVWGVVALAIVAALVALSWPRPFEVDADTLRTGPLVVTIEAEGRTRVQRRYVVAAPLAGQLARIELRPGDVVQAGAVIARLLPAAAPLLDPRTRAELEGRLRVAEDGTKQSDATVERAALALEAAEREALRMEELAGSGGVSRQQLDAARTEARARALELASTRYAAEVARHEVSTAKAALGRTGAGGRSGSFDVAAPAAGRVLRVLQPSEGPVAPGTPLLEIGDPAALELVIDVLTADAVRLSPGAPATITRWGGDAALEGRVRLVEPSAFTRLSALGVEEQRVAVIVDLTSPRAEWERLGDGYRVEVSLQEQRADEVLLAPAGALVRRGEGWALLVIEAGIIREAPVELGRRGGRVVELLRGPPVGARVVVHPSDKLVAGATVRAR